MRLKFSILWFDDTAEFFDSLDIDWLSAEISSWGFSPNIRLVTTPQEFAKYSPYQSFDLIIVDRNLEEYGEGQNFIADLRSNSIYTEVIFYTAGTGADLWDDIRAKQLEGVFVSNRATILAKIVQVGRQSIRKVLDLENMRGIVMAEVGEIDHILDEIITVGIKGLSAEHQNSIFTRFHKDLSKRNQELADRLVTFSKTPALEELLDLCDSSKRWENFIRLWKYHNKLKDQQAIGNYQADVLAVRNILAHGKPEIFEGGYLFRYYEKEYIFNDESGNELRKTILKYKDAFSHVLTMLQE